jgi:hypothetical protein
MSIKSVDEEPQVTLTRWVIVAPDDTGHLHLIGRKPNGEGRISSPIASFDLATMTGQTASGRYYKLEGKPEANAGAVMRIVVAKSWGGHLVDRVRAVALKEAALAMPVRGRA